MFATPSTTLLTTAACVWLVGCGGTAEPPPPTAPVDHVILISIDSLRADHLGAYGYPAPTSPTIDRLADSGLLFERAYTTSSWTLPAHASMMTGLDTLAHGQSHDKRRLAAGVETLAEALQSDGISTYGFFSGPYLHPAFGFARGFDRYTDCSTSTGLKISSRNRRAINRASHADITNPNLIDALDRLLDEGVPRERSFWFFHMWDVHYDYVAPQRFVDLFDPDYDGPITGENFANDPRIQPDMPARDLEHLLALYDAETRYTDETLGLLLERLRRSGLEERVAILVVSDHGDEFFEHGRKGHRKTLYEEVLRVPIILHVDGRQPALPSIDQPVSLIDLYDTVCDLLGVGCEAPGPAQSLWPYYLSGSGDEARGDALAQLRTKGKHNEIHALVQADGKLIHWSRRNLWNYFNNRQLATETQTLRFRRVEKLSPRSPAARIHHNLESRIETARALRGRLANPADTDQPALDEATREHLESLGYLE